MKPFHKVLSKLRLEHAIMVVFVGFSALFALEIAHFFDSGLWIIHAGATGFAKWPQPAEQARFIMLHSLGMLAWIGIVIYQLQTRGKGAHAWIGRIGTPLVLLALVIAWGPAVATTVPALHALGGFTLADVTLLVNFIAIAVETVVGAAKARERRIAEHRQHLMAAIMFTAAPGLYRALFILLGWCTGIGADTAPTQLQSIWLHELSASIAIFIGASVLLSRTFSGHRAVLRGDGPKRPRPSWQKPTAVVMLSIGCLVLGIYAVWIVDLLMLDLEKPIQLFHRTDAPIWRTYF